MLGDADAVGAGRVDDEDAARARGGDVDVVDAGAGAGDRSAACGAAASSARVDLRRAADEQRVGVGEIGGELGGRSPGAGIDRPAFGAEQFERGSRKVVGDDDFHRELQYNPCVSNAPRARAFASPCCGANR